VTICCRPELGVPVVGFGGTRPLTGGVDAVVAVAAGLGVGGGVEISVSGGGSPVTGGAGTGGAGAGGGAAVRAVAGLWALRVARPVEAADGVVADTEADGVTEPLVTTGGDASGGSAIWSTGPDPRAWPRVR
jgi:hypothetical protein